MVAGAYPTVSCVIAEAAPIDLNDLDPETRAGVAQVFGEDNLGAMSPINNLAAPGTEVLLASSDSDPYVPGDQAAAYQRARPEDTTVMTMPPGSEVQFVHTYTTRAALDRLQLAEWNLLRRLAGLPEASPAAEAPASPGSSSPGTDAMRVGSPIRDARRGIARIPVQVEWAGVLRLAGRGVYSRDKPVEAGQLVRLKVRPHGRLERAVRRKGHATAPVEITLTGPPEPAIATVEVELRRR
jgi:hypothetical protein